MSLTNPNKVITEERLSAFYQDILPYLGGMPEILANKFSRSDIYSTTEKMIGQWTDGKPLYQKIVTTGGSVPSGATLIFRQAMTGYDAILYTKTADSAISIGSDTDYSTDEKIVGTDTDGKWIWQKTIPVTLPTTSTQGTVVTEDYSIGASIYRLKNLIGEFKSQSGVCFVLPAFSTNRIDSRVSASVLDNTSTTPNVLRILNSNPTWNELVCNVTLQYIKTS